MITRFTSFTKRMSKRVLAGILLATAGMSTAGNAQTTLISPTGAGGFELGTTFAANGWTLVNTPNATDNHWEIATANLTQGTYTFAKTGNNAAFITNSATANTWAYSAPNTGVHFYRDVTFPAAEPNATLSFRWNCLGEATNWDALYVYLAPTTVTPLLGSPSGSSTVPVWGGTGTPTLIGGPYYQLPAGAGQTSTINIPQALIGNTTAASTRRLVFVWKNDGGVFQPPVAIDDISLISNCVSSIASQSPSAVGTTTASLTWTAVAGATGYTVRYKLPGDPVTVPTWATPTTTATNSITLTGLTASSTYEFQVAATGPVCNVYTGSSTFTTACAGPTVLTNTPASRCGTGTLSLSATGSAGSTLRWYGAAIGGAALGTGSPFVTPTIASTTPYYVSAGTSAAAANATIGAGALTTSGFTSTSPYNHFYGGLRIQYLIRASELIAAGVSAGNFNSLAFDVTTAGTSYTGFSISLAPTTLTALTAPPLVTTGFTQVYSSASVTPTTGINVYPFTPTFSWDGSSNVIVNICWSNNNGGGTNTEVRYDNTTYISAAYARTDNATAATVCGGASAPFSNGTFTSRPKMIFNYNGICEGPRVLVNATISTAPAITVSSPQGAGVCTGSTATINVTSPNSGYTYSWTPGAFTGSSITVTPATSTTYTVVANDAVTNCTRTDTFRVNVNPQPGVPTLTPATSTICAGSSVILTAANAAAGGGPLSLLAESFEGTGLGAFTKTNGPLNTAAAASDWAQYTNGSTISGVGTVTSTYGTKFAASNADAGGGGAFFTQTYLTTTNSYNTTGVTNLNLSFRNHYVPWGGDVPTVQASSDNGVTWTTVYTVPAATIGSTTALALTNIPLTAYQNVANLKVRFNYYSNWGYAWVVDSVNLYGTGPTAGPGDINYTNVTGLYKDAALTQALAATDTNKVVYASPATNQTYTVRTNNGGCLSAPSANASITVNPAPPSAITAGGPTTICQGQNVVLSAPAGTYTYRWNRNGSPVFGPTSTSQNYTADTAGSYTVTVTNPASSPTPCSFTSVTPIVVTVNPAPPTTITASGTLNFCVGGSVTLSAPVAPTGVTYTYIWRDGGTPITGQTGQTLVVTTSRSVTVTVTNAASTCSATTVTPTVVTVGTPPPAPISAATSTTICQGQTVRLRTSNTPGLTYQWNNASGPIPGATDSFYNAGAAGNYTVTVAVSANCVSTSAPITVTVNPLPASAIAAGGPITFCQGGNVVLTASPTGANLNYQWQIGNAPTNPPTTSTTFTATTSGSYTVIVTNTSTGCFAASAPTVVTVNALPVASFTPSATQTICAGSTTTFSANTGTGLTYQWFNGANPIAGATAATYTANAAGTYTVRVTNANTCTATSSATTVNVTPLPAATTTPNGPINLCAADTLTITGPTGTGYTYQWRLGATNAPGVSTSRDYRASVAGSYTVVVTANGCSATSVATTVNLLAAPTALMNPITATTACDSVVLTSASTGVTYQWRFNGNDIVGANNATYAATASGNYSLRVTGSNGCSANTPGPGTPVTINPSPNGTITYASPLVFCQGGAVVLNTFSGNNFTFEWRRDTTVIAGASTNSYITSQSGSYSVKVVNTVTGCSKVSAPIVVKVNPLPQPEIAYDEARNELSTTQTYAQYQWYRNTQPLTAPGSFSRVYKPTANGAYSVTVTDTNGCTSGSTITFVNGVGIKQTAAGASVRIYPNPTTGLLHVDAQTRVNLVLRDVTGKTVLKADNEKELNVEQLADGMYLLYISDMQGQLIRAEKITKSAR